MKKAFIFIAFITAVFFSCKKAVPCDPGNSGFTSIVGKWRMIIVTDNLSGLATSKPAAVQGNVDITFTSAAPVNGFFSGNTPTNSIMQNEYSIGNNGTISIPNLSMTKVTETSWGSAFVDHIRNSREYFFESNGDLSIKTISKTLTFTKL